MVKFLELLEARSSLASESLLAKPLWDELSLSLFKRLPKVLLFSSFMLEVSLEIWALYLRLIDLGSISKAKRVYTWLLFSIEPMGSWSGRIFCTRLSKIKTNSNYLLLTPNTLPISFFKCLTYLWPLTEKECRTHLLLVSNGTQKKCLWSSFTSGMGKLIFM